MSETAPFPESPVTIEELLVCELEVLGEYVKEAVTPTERDPAQPGAIQTWRCPVAQSQVKVTRVRLPDGRFRQEVQANVTGIDGRQKEWRLDQRADGEFNLSCFAASEAAAGSRAADASMGDITSMKMLAQQVAALSYAEPRDGPNA